MASAPLVSVMIAAHGRPDELRHTLGLLRDQSYQPVEVLVVDDASPEPLEPVVREVWPDARVWRHPRNLGLIASRSELMRAARGAFLLSLDDDSHLIRPDAIAVAVERFAREPQLGAIACLVYEGDAPPADGRVALDERYVTSYVGCGHVLRAAAVREVGGYRDFFEYYGEEAEYALRLLDRGWRIVLCPQLVVHHRVSPVGRSTARIARYSFRNSLWTLVLNVPFPRVLLELAWKAVSNAVETVRVGWPRGYVWALASCVRGLPRVLRLRRPVGRDTLRAYDALRFGTVRDPDELAAARGLTAGAAVRWLWTVWRHRRRARAFWARPGAGIGKSPWLAEGSEPSA